MSFKDELHSVVELSEYCSVTLRKNVQAFKLRIYLPNKDGVSLSLNQRPDCNLLIVCNHLP